MSRLANWLLEQFGYRYIVMVMVLSRIFGSVSGLLVIYYVELALDLPSEIRWHFRIAAIIVVLIACTLTVYLALRETRRVRRVQKRLDAGDPVDAEDLSAACCEAMTFPARHHWLEAWVVPCSTLLPVLTVLRLLDGASLNVLINISIAVFMGIAMALMSTFFVVEYCMQPLIRHLLDHGAVIDYDTLPRGRLRFRFGVCSSLIIMTTALMIGTVARQRAVSIAHETDPSRIAQAVTNLRLQSTYIMIVAVGTGIIFSVVLSNSVASRVQKLVHAMTQVQQGEMSQRMQPTGNDEVDALARAFNDMIDRIQHNDETIRDLNLTLEKKVEDRTRELQNALQELQETQTRLTDLAHQAGMAEIATGVLHNVGNALNSVNLSTELLTDRLRHSRIQEFIHFTQRLARQDDPEAFLQKDGRATKLLNYLNVLSSKLEDERSQLVRETRSLAEKVDHIKGIISTQQEYARSTAFCEQADIRKLVEDVLEIHGALIEKHGIEVTTSFAESGSTYTEKAKLAQVIENLVKNAIESLAEVDRQSRELSIHVDSLPSGWLRLVVADTGIGIAPDRCEKIFGYGFTTKTNGSGFGLHSAALAVGELGGRIAVDSDGPGRGAQFTIELPNRRDTDEKRRQAETEESTGLVKL